MATPRSDRMKITYSLTTREKRAMSAQLQRAQEDVESAIEARDKLIVDLWKRGLSIANIVLATGIGHMSVKKTLGTAGVDDPG